MFAHLLHAQPWDIHRWTYLELMDRKQWVDDYLTSQKK